MSEVAPSAGTGRVFVPGSINVDVTAFVRRRPGPGETVTGESFQVGLGGKGANQGCAASLAGAHAVMIGCVGDDAFSVIARDALTGCGVDVAAVRTVAGPTGIAHIRVDSEAGQNDIVVVPLANASLTAELTAEELRSRGRAGDVVLLQLEVPPTTTAAIAQVAHVLGMRVILDPAPAVALPEQIWPYVDIVTPNEHEAAVLTGQQVRGVDDAVAAGQWFLTHGARTALITLGGAGVVEVHAGGHRHLRAPTVQVVDTTAAGDAFTGNLGAALAAGLPWDDCLQRALAAGALTVGRAGASASLPTLDETLTAMEGSR